MDQSERNKQRYMIQEYEQKIKKLSNSLEDLRISLDEAKQQNYRLKNKNHILEEKIKELNNKIMLLKFDLEGGPYKIYELKNIIKSLYKYISNADLEKIRHQHNLPI